MNAPVKFVAPDKDLDVCPIKPIGWRVVIAPYEPENKTGSGILLAESAVEAERFLTFCGQLVAMGEACFKATTRSGLAMADWQEKPKVGDWVIYGAYGGQRVVTKGNTRYMITNDDAILAVARSPRDFKYYI
jgi:co-chaperonin GroES (HSP10)